MSKEDLDVTLPAIRNDEPTLQERMSDNAYNQILPARYLKRDENGETIEEPEEFFERIAKNISIAEAIHTDDEVYISRRHIKPDHPRRQELIDEVFGEDEDEVLLDEKNAKHVAYDPLFEDLPQKTQNVVKDAKEWFQRDMEHLDFMPNTPTLINAGNELQQLSACFVNSPGDDMENIHQTAKEAALTFQSGGGMGYSFSQLRPYGDTVGSTGGIASGPLTFMATFDRLCETIAQGGARRGAQMGVMRVDHPDVIKFIHAKNKDVSLAEELRLNDPDDFTHNSFGEALEEAREHINDDGTVAKHLRNAAEGNLSNFNISVAITDRFMEALEAGEDFEMINPRTEEPHIASPETKEMYGWFDLDEYVEVGEPLTIPAQELWDRIIEGSHENGEPGVIYIDRVNQFHSFDVEEEGNEEYEVIATNPCGEQPLMEMEACNLGHINLSTIVRKDAPNWHYYDGDIETFLKEAIDFDELNSRIANGTRFLDNVVTMSNFPVEEIEEAVRKNRKIGLGIMGLAQMYVQIGVRYGSDAGNDVARIIMRHINHESKRVSHDLAVERGSFVNWDDSKYADPTEYEDWFEHLVGQHAEKWAEGFPVRNHNTTTIAPTGTTSMIGNTSGGCEPIFNVAYYKNVTDDVQGDEMLVEFDVLFLKILEANDIDVEAVKQEAADLMADNEFESVSDLTTVPSEIGDLFVTTNDLSGIEHAMVLCACQQGVDSSISKTCNVPNDATIEEMADVYEYIYKHGGKSATVYRDGSRSKQVLTTRADNQAVNAEEVGFDEWLESNGYESMQDFIENGEEFEAIESPVSVIGGNPNHREAPDQVNGSRYRIKTGYGKMYVTIGEDEHGIVEVMATVGKSGGFNESMCEALARQISQSFQWGVPVEEVIDQLEGIRSPAVGWDQGDQVQSIPDGIALALKRHTQAKTETEATSKNMIDNTGISKESDGGVDEDAGMNESTKELIADGENPECPDCGAMQLHYSEGCKRCESCGWSEC